METKIIGKFNPFKEEMFQVMKLDGSLNNDFMPELSDDELKEMYKNMVMMRMVDDKAVKLQRQGRMGTYPSIKGQEACQIGAGFASDPGVDFVVPAFRETAAMWMGGVTVAQIYAYWMGMEEGSFFNEGVNVLPVSIPVGSQIIHGAGIGWGLRLKGSEGVALTYFGDGATSEGSFHEGLNFASRFNSHTVFLCQNNQYGISTSRQIQTKSKTLAQKAYSYAMDGVLVDGNDILAVYAACSEAVSLAREGRPVLLELYTYRMSDHTTADDASRYRPEGELEEWEKKDPILRFKNYLEGRGLWDQKFDESVLAEGEKLVVEGVEGANKMVSNVDVLSMFDYLYAEKDARLLSQREDLSKYLDKKE